MLENPNVFILGAGASSEAGLPVGDKLVETISDDINFEIDSFGELSPRGNRELKEVIIQHLQSDAKPDDSLYAHVSAGQRISAAAKVAKSIDEVLYQLDDDLVSFVGKLAIARAILDAENCANFSNPKNRPAELNINGLSKTWYMQFGRMLTEPFQKSSASSVGKNTTIISFNYDRTVEHFLTRFLEQRFDITRQKSEAIVNNMDIIHPYGTVGRLEWQKNSNPESPPIEFGGGNRPNLIAAASQIRTYTEQVAEKSVVRRMSAAISGAAKLVFLGFGFHQQNMDLLEAEKPNFNCKVYATAFEESNSNIDMFRWRIRRALFSDEATTSQLDYAARYNIVDKKCVKLFEDYGLEIAG